MAGKDDIDKISEEIDKQSGAVPAQPSTGPEDDGETKESLRAKLLEANQRAEENARRAEDERKARLRTNNDLTDTRLLAVDNALSDTDSKLADAKKRKTDAYTAGDYAAAADIDIEVAEYVAKKRDLVRGKENIQAEIEDRKTRPVVADPVEAYVANMAPEAQRWIRQHPEVVTDSVKNAELTLAHQRTLREGVRVDTPEYYRAMTEKMGYGAPGMNGDNGSMSGGDTEEEERRQPPAAPPSRGTVNTQTGQPERTTKRRLTPQQREVAKLSNMTEVEYAQELDRLEKEGRLSPQQGYVH